MLLAGPSCSYFEYTEFIDGVDVLNIMTEKGDKVPVNKTLHRLIKIVF